MAFLAAARAQQDDAHLNIALAVNCLPPGARHWTRLAVRLCMLAFLGVLVYSGTLVAQITVHHRSTALQLPMAAVYAALPVGSALMMLFLGLQILRDLRGPRP